MATALCCHRVGDTGWIRRLGNSLGLGIPHFVVGRATIMALLWLLAMACTTALSCRYGTPLVARNDMHNSGIMPVYIPRLF